RTGGSEHPNRAGQVCSPKLTLCANEFTPQYQRSGELVRANRARSWLSILSRALGCAGGAVGGRRGRALAEGCVPSHQRGNSPTQCSGFTWISAAIRASL